nr:MAG TPA: hypothetical protein [Caudoviricetes sp.]
MAFNVKNNICVDTSIIQQNVGIKYNWADFTYYYRLRSACYNSHC